MKKAPTRFPKPEVQLPNIILCVIFDLLGFVSYLLPVLGEAEDLLWAPISGIAFYFLFGKRKFGLLGGLFSFLEELSPGMDLVPTFTIAWFIRKHELEKYLKTQKKFA